LLRSHSTYFKLRGANLIAAVVCVDSDNRFERIFDEYYDLLDGRSVIAAAYIAGNSGKIATAHPEIQGRITDRLLNTDQTHHPPERKDLIKGHAVEALGEYFQASADKAAILEFVGGQLESRNPRTRKKAKEFLEEWGDTTYRRNATRHRRLYDSILLLGPRPRGWASRRCRRALDRDPRRWRP
jgi:hypothetical protein